MIKPLRYLDEANDEDVIWRYMNLAKFMDMVLTKSLWFVRQDKFADKLEGTIPIENKFKFLEELKKKDPIRSSYERYAQVFREADNIESFKKFTLVNSWTLKKAESMALWKIYLSNSSNGIAIQSTVGKYKESLKKCGFEISPIKINYIDEFAKLTHINQEVIAGTKLNFYNYEDEFRGVIFNQFKINKESEDGKTPIYEYGVNVPVDCNVLITRIAISPLAPDWFANIIINVKNDYLDNSEQIQVKKSRLKERI